jgi:hypothetical protein
MDDIQRLTAKLLQEREMRRVAERSARYQQQAKRLKAKLAALAHHKPDPPAEATRAGAQSTTRARLRVVLVLHSASHD